MNYKAIFITGVFFISIFINQSLKTSFAAFEEDESAPPMPWQSPSNNSAYTGLDLILVIDQSGSMGGALFNQPARQASDPNLLRFYISQFALSWLGDYRFYNTSEQPPLIRVSVVSFGTNTRDTLVWANVGEGNTYADWTNQYFQYADLLSVQRFGLVNLGLTDHYAAINRGYQLFDEAPKPTNQSLNQLRAVVLFTDGQPCNVNDLCLGSRSIPHGEDILRQVYALVSTAFSGNDYRMYVVATDDPSLEFPYWNEFEDEWDRIVLSSGSGSSAEYVEEDYQVSREIHAVLRNLTNELVGAPSTSLQSTSIGGGSFTIEVPPFQQFLRVYILKNDNLPLPNEPLFLVNNQAVTTWRLSEIGQRPPETIVPSSQSWESPLLIYEFTTPAAGTWTVSGLGNARLDLVSDGVPLGVRVSPSSPNKPQAPRSPASPPGPPKPLGQTTATSNNYTVQQYDTLSLEVEITSSLRGASVVAISRDQNGNIPLDVTATLLDKRGNVVLANVPFQDNPDKPTVYSYVLAHQIKDLPVGDYDLRVKVSYQYNGQEIILVENDETIGQVSVLETKFIINGLPPLESNRLRVSQAIPAPLSAYATDVTGNPLLGLSEFVLVANLQAVDGVASNLFCKTPSPELSCDLLSGEETLFLPDLAGFMQTSVTINREGIYEVWLQVEDSFGQVVYGPENKGVITVRDPRPLRVEIISPLNGMTMDGLKGQPFFANTELQIDVRVVDSKLNQPVDLSLASEGRQLVPRLEILNEAGESLLVADFQATEVAGVYSLRTNRFGRGKYIVRSYGEDNIFSLDYEWDPINPEASRISSVSIERAYPFAIYMWAAGVIFSFAAIILLLAFFYFWHNHITEHPLSGSITLYALHGFDPPIPQTLKLPNNRNRVVFKPGRDFKVHWPYKSIVVSTNRVASVSKEHDAYITIIRSTGEKVENIQLGTHNNSIVWNAPDGTTYLVGKDFADEAEEAYYDNQRSQPQAQQLNTDIFQYPYTSTYIVEGQ